eukprot:1736769-Pyramimonas_sp.AAC.1
MTAEWKRHHSLTTLMNQAAGETVHCAWMASCASGNLPLSTPVAERAQHQCPIPGAPGEPPSASAAPQHQDHGPCRPAYEELKLQTDSLD